MISAHVVSLELSKQLKEIGYPQEDSEFYYANCESDSNPQWMTVHKEWIIPSAPYPPKVAAPLAMDLIDILPESISVGPGVPTGTVQMLSVYSGRNTVLYQDVMEASPPMLKTNSSSLQDALALMVLELHKGGLLTFEKKYNTSRQSHYLA